MYKNIYEKDALAYAFQFASCRPGWLLVDIAPRCGASTRSGRQRNYQRNVGPFYRSSSQPYAARAERTPGTAPITARPRTQSAGAGQPLRAGIRLRGTGE